MTLRDTPLGPGAEFDAIREMLRRWGPRARGIGDDAALLDVPAGQQLAVSTDSSVEDVHFRRGWLEPPEIGYRATVAALSDLAAVGATPLGLVCALAIPEDWRAALHDLTDGVGEAASRYETPIVGGNITRGAKLSLTVTVLGAVEHPLPRSGVRPGDVLYVTGTLGASGAALDALVAGRAPSPAQRERFARPIPRIAEARWLATHGATAAIDVSDGLLAELAHLAAASGVRLELDAARVPVAEGVARERALRSGEEYELVVASRKLDAAAFVAAHGVALTPIGRATAPHGGGSPSVEIVGEGARVANERGHDHLSS
ncbi:MAG TPA: thiamine-phosphate kinase [Gemmatimonadaceae bacterium]|nr:thiamine-phosphate kinase [Gemmatimonadaceae bacterium]